MPTLNDPVVRGNSLRFGFLVDFAHPFGGTLALRVWTRLKIRIWSRNNDCLPVFRFSNQSIKLAVVVISKNILFLTVETVDPRLEELAMRICLTGSLNFSSWQNQDRGETESSPSLGLLSLAAVLEQAGHEVALLDLNHEVASGSIPLSQRFYDCVAERILAERPMLVGFSTMCNSYHISLRMAEVLKKRLPKVPIVLGGPQASVVDVETLRAFPFVDFVLRGEAEVSLPGLVEELAAGQQSLTTCSLTWRNARSIVRNPDSSLLPDLDSLPLPAYHLLPTCAKDSGIIDAGRGCPFQCTFCSTSVFWKRRFRLKSIERIIHEIRTLKGFGATAFTFQHDLFTVNRKRINEFCDRLLDEQLEISWGCSARVDCVTPELLDHMGRAGCNAIFYGVETGSARMQQIIRKKLKLNQVWDTLNATLKAGISPTVSFIAGFPDETEEDLQQTLNMIQTLLGTPKVSVQLHLLGPEPGTPDYQHYHDRLRLDGYHSDIAGTVYRFQEPEWFRKYPDLFSSFYYYESAAMPRDLLRGLDLFIHAPCAILRKTVNRLFEGGRSLWQLYNDWRSFADPRGLGLGPSAGQKLEDYLLDFYAFLDWEVSARRSDIDLGTTRDEILTHLFLHHGELPVRVVPRTRRTSRPRRSRRSMTQTVNSAG
jgi:radical SAM superfamily enzyme YgiQ (UPF0313 family)